jgi:hypothetical protein
MERSFIATEECEYYKDNKRYESLAMQQKQFVKEFLLEKGIEATKYIVGGNGFVNQPFRECSKKDIILSIEPTMNDLVTFGRYLTKPDQHNLCSFKKNSKIAKDFAKKCIDEQIIINLWSPKPRDYFKSISYMAYSYQQFEYDNKLYIIVKSEYLKEDDTPTGFNEIKLSKYYQALEELEGNN